MGRRRNSQRGWVERVTLKRTGEEYWRGRFRVYDSRGKAKEKNTFLGRTSQVTEEDARLKLLGVIERMNSRRDAVRDIGTAEVLKRDLEFSGQPQKFLIGSISEHIVAADLMARGYEVFKAVHGQASCDLIALKGDLIQRVEVKTAAPYLKGQIKRNIGKFDIAAVFSRETGRVRYISALELSELETSSQCGTSVGPAAVKPNKTQDNDSLGHHL